MSYDKYPKSIAEHKALEEGDCQLWTPRDLLLYYLRRIDGGETFDGLMVVYIKKGDVSTATGAHRAQVKLLEALGALEAAKYDMLAE